jgi:hypothetical protein
MIIKKTRNQIHAEKVGQAFANNIFKDMLNPNYQGDNFSWDHFPENFAKMCISQIFMSFKDGVKNLDNLKAIGEAAYLEEGKKLKDQYSENNILPVKNGSQIKNKM